MFVFQSAYSTLFRHKVTGWSIGMDPKSKSVVYDISFKRLPSELSMDLVLCRPWSDEAEDYKEYKRIRQLVRDRNSEAVKARLDKVPTFAVSSDGAAEVFKDQTAQPLFNRSFDVKYRDGAVSPRTVLGELSPERNDVARG